MYFKQLRGNRGFSLQFATETEFNKLLKFLRATSSDACHALANKLDDAASDQYATDVVALTTPLWIEDVPVLLTALYVNEAVKDNAWMASLMQTDNLLHEHLEKEQKEAQEGTDDSIKDLDELVRELEKDTQKD